MFDAQTARDIITLSLLVIAICHAVQLIRSLR